MQLISYPNVLTLKQEDIFVIIKSRVREREVLCFSRACVNYFKRKMRYHRIREILEDLSDTNSKG